MAWLRRGGSRLLSRGGELWAREGRTFSKSARRGGRRLLRPTCRELTDGEGTTAALVGPNGGGDKTRFSGGGGGVCFFFFSCWRATSHRRRQGHLAGGLGVMRPVHARKRARNHAHASATFAASVYRRGCGKHAARRDEAEWPMMTRRRARPDAHAAALGRMG